MGMDGAEYEQYEYEPGPRLRERLVGAWRRAFGGWSPEQRSLGVIIVAWYLAGLLSQLAIIDLTWQQFLQVVQPVPMLGGHVPLQEVVNVAARLLTTPMLVVVIAGGLGLAMRRGWGREVAVVGRAGLLLLQVVEVGVSLAEQGGGGLGVRFRVSEVLGVVASVLPLLVLLWSRPAQEDL
jgi:hypothetical protein